jgi:hypothetical protein
MISDVLFEAVEGMDHYLNDSGQPYATWYSGDLRERLLALREQMNAIREELDRG